MTVISTARLTLRPACADDIEVVRRLESDPVVRRYLGGPADPAAVAAIKPGAIGKRWGAYLFALTDGPVAGAVNLDRERGELEISYLQLPEFWGQGLVTEAALALLEWAAGECPEEHVIAVTQAANVESRALLTRLGFTLRQTFEEFGATQVLLERPLSIRVLRCPRGRSSRG